MKNLIFVIILFGSCSSFASEAPSASGSKGKSILDWPHCKYSAAGCTQRVLELPRNCERSKNPKCWDSSHSSGFSEPPKLSCNDDGTVTVSGSIGEGPGCGEGPRLSMEKLEIDPYEQTVSASVAKAWPLGETQTPQCHYWGPLYDSFGLELKTGVWKIFVNGAHIGDVEIEASTETSASDSTAVAIKNSCSVIQSAL